MYGITKHLPRSHVSRLVGWLARIPVPRFMRGAVIGTFASAAGADPATASKPLTEYSSVDEFFTRDLKAGERPIGEGVVSPVDGVLRSCGTVSNGVALLVKGREYSIAALLGDGALAAEFEGGTYLNFYLAPPDYHHVHSPLDGRIFETIYSPGTLWPVNDWGAANIPGLLAENERVAILLETAGGLVAVVMVGAMSVGYISLEFDPLETNRGARTPAERRRQSYEPCFEAARGRRLGTFHLGSAVVVLGERGAITPHAGLASGLPKKVRLGETLGSAVSAKL